MTAIALEMNDEEILTYDISDEALEAAVGTVIAGQYTLGMCTGVTDCPGSKRIVLPSQLVRRSEAQNRYQEFMSVRLEMR
jgi:hypothetical protein